MNSNSGPQCPCNEHRACLNSRGPHISNNASSVQNQARCASDTLSQQRHSADQIRMKEHSKETAVHVQYKPQYDSRNSSVGIATRYGMDGPGIESRRERDFLHPSRPALGPTQPPIQWVPGVKRPGRGVDHPPASSAEDK